MKNSFISALSILLFLVLHFPVSLAAPRGRKGNVKGVRSRRTLQKETADTDANTGKGTKLETKGSVAKKETKSAKGKLKGDPETRIQGTPELKTKKRKCKKGPAPTNIEVELPVIDEQGLPVPPEPIACEEEMEYNADMVRFATIERNCDAIANDVGPTTTPWTSFMVTADVVKEEGVQMKTIYTAMEEELQKYVAPVIAGCEEEDSTGERKLKKTNIVHVDFQSLEHNRGACRSSLAMQANAVGDACLSTDVPLTVYYLGEGDAEEYLSEIQKNIKNYKWNVTGVKDTDIIAVAITGSSEENPTSLPIPAIGAGVAALVAFVAIFVCYRRSSNTEPLMAAVIAIDSNTNDNNKVEEIDTESETDDEKEKHFVPQAVAEPIYNIEEGAVEISAY